jgi:hypothetical protein
MWFTGLIDEEEGAMEDYSCEPVDVSYYPSEWFKDKPKNFNSLITYIEENNLWKDGYIRESLNNVKKSLMDEYYIYYDKKEKDYLFNQDNWNNDHIELYKKNSEEYKREQVKAQVLFLLIREKWDNLFFDAQRAKNCGSYNKHQAIEKRKKTKNKLFEHFNNSHCNNGNCKFQWLNGEYADFPDPRTYYNYEKQKYEFKEFKSDLRDAVYMNKSELIGSNEEASNLLEYHQQAWLSRFSEFMYTRGVNEIPDLKDNNIKQKIKNEFYKCWGSTDPYGFYWKWNTLKEERIERERQKLLKRLEAEKRVKEYLEDQENKAVMAMITGGVGAVTGITIMVIFPPSSLGTIVGLADIGFSVSTFVEGLAKYKDIQEEMFDPNKEYNVVKGILVDLSGNYGQEIGVFYDLSEILSGFSSAGGNIMNIRKLKTLSGNELEIIVKGLNSGSGTVSTGEKIFYLSNENSNNENN